DKGQGELRRIEPAARAREQGRTDCPFQRIDVPRCCWLCQGELPRRARQAPLLHHRQEGTPMFPVHIHVHAFSYITCTNFINSRICPSCVPCKEKHHRRQP